VTLVDTSVWIDFFTGRDLPHVSKLEHLILNDEDLALCGIILTEILQGIGDSTTVGSKNSCSLPMVVLEQSA